MPESEDMAFLVMRERQSRELAAVPGDIAVQRAHLAMADRYAARISTLKSQAL
jgi:hypothetical protein